LDQKTIEQINVNYKTCDISLEFPTLEPTLAGITTIDSREEGKGHGRGCMEKVEKMCKERKIVWLYVFNVMNIRMATLLSNLGYRIIKADCDNGKALHFRKQM